MPLDGGPSMVLNGYLNLLPKSLQCVHVRVLQVHSFFKALVEKLVKYQEVKVNIPGDYGTMCIIGSNEGFSSVTTCILVSDFVVGVLHQFFSSCTL